VAATRLAAKLKTPLQIGQHLVRAFEAGFEVGAKPVDETVVEAVLCAGDCLLRVRLTEFALCLSYCASDSRVRLR
jgi:hypothetical protein